ncbi:Rha family transcriptional regulator [Xenorhabdus sp. TS4]|uniref:Rha family transcriptional regulator n=1 Tax=Xenorhabdus sp. TS4 TaxID=1873483 RepID=UPI0016575B72|nr:Rha family transcriptional regulator [Xenorhabdus sp. TS4]MBC8949384.1 antirepressor [Xenorhabdus sp. TS4]
MKILAPATQAVTMSSREIAELTGKRISDIHRDIRAMVPALYAVDNGENVKSYKWDTDKDKMMAFLLHYKIQGVKVNFDDRGYVYEFLLDRRHTEILVTGYDVKRRAAVIDRWFALESNVRKITKSQSGLPEYRFAKAEQLKSVALEKNIASIERLTTLLPNLDHLAKQSFAASVINPIVGFAAIPLPALEEKYYTAGEVGKMLDVSANKIGRVANEHKLKNEQHGKFFLDKSAHSDKQVEAFRYNENGIKALRHLIHGVEVA